MLSSHSHRISCNCVTNLRQTKEGPQWNSGSWSVEVLLGVSQAIDSQGFRLLSWPKNWKPIHLLGCQKTRRSKHKNARTLKRDKFRFEMFLARKSGRRKTEASCGISTPSSGPGDHILENNWGANKFLSAPLGGANKAFLILEACCSEKWGSIHFDSYEKLKNSSASICQPQLMQQCSSL